MSRIFLTTFDGLLDRWQITTALSWRRGRMRRAEALGFADRENELIRAARWATRSLSDSRFCLWQWQFRHEWVQDKTRWHEVALETIAPSWGKPADEGALRLCAPRRASTLLNARIFVTPCDRKLRKPFDGHVDSLKYAVGNSFATFLQRGH